MQSHTEMVALELALFHEKWNNYSHDFVELMRNSNGQIYPLDLIIYGIIKRIISTSSAIELLINNFNLTCARSILRMQLDNVCRLSAFWLSDDPQNMARNVLKGQQINHIKDRDNKKMTDGYLVNKLKDKYTWINQVYSQTSGYIHLSGQHFIASINNYNTSNNTLQLDFSDTDIVDNENSWIEILKCSSECIEIVFDYIVGYNRTKELIT